MISLLVTTPSVAADRENPLQHLMAELDSAAAKLADCSYELRVEHWSTYSGRVEGNIEAKVVRAGDRLRCKVSKSTRFIDKGNVQTMAGSILISDDGALVWPEGNPAAFEYPHDSVATMSDEARDALGPYAPADPFLYSFGNGSQPLTVLRTLHPTEHRWEVEECKLEGGSAGFRLKTFTPRVKDPKRPTFVFSIDADHGFLVTRFVAYTADSAVAHENIITPIRVSGSDTWYPGVIEERVHRTDGNAAAPIVAPGVPPGLVKRRLISVLNFRVGDKVAADTFAVSSLKLPPTVKVIRHEQDGRRRVLKQIDGVYVPEEAADELLRQQRLEPKNAKVGSRAR
jgi:hypothetical protein